MSGDTEAPEQLIDPDPFVVGLGLIQIMAAGGAFLEARRQRQAIENTNRNEFRVAWYDSRRSLIHFKRTADEFETHVLEEGFGRRAFRIGVVRLQLDFRKHKAIRRLLGQTATTAQHLADNLDDLSNFLGSEDQLNIDAIHKRLEEITGFPETYREVIRTAREVAELFNDLLQDIGERESFEESPG